MRFTARGLGTIAAGVALLGTGSLFGYPELALLGAAAWIAVGCALGYAVVQPVLTVRRAVDPDRVTRGEASTQTLTVGNASRLLAATLVAHDACGDRTVPVPLVRLPRGQDTAVSYPVPTHRRGVVRVGPLTVSRRDPLGLIDVSREHGGTATVWVYPRTHRLSAVPAGIARSLDGRIDRVPHGSITFDTLREYVIGDELRHVHWRTTARVGELMVREHLDTSLPRIVVLLDDRARSYGDPDGFEHACEAAASVLVAAVREELPVDLFTVTGREAPSHRGPALGLDQPVSVLSGHRADARPLLDRLAEAEPVRGGGLDQALKRLRQYRLGDTLVYLTGVPDDLAAVGALRPTYPTVVAGVFGNAEPVEGMHVLSVRDAAAFARAWDGIGQW
jgi:uncharacterized protein (DUF58 family)